MPEPQPATCAAGGCERVGRWPVSPRGKTWCDSHLEAMVVACDATALRLGDGPGDLFRTRHNPCGAVVDVTLPMIRRGGWVCLWCKLSASTAQALGYSFPIAQARATDVEQQETVLAAAGMRTLIPLVSQPWGAPLNVECLECGTAQVNSAYGLSEGVRLSWLPCQRCNAQRFAVTTSKVAERLERLGMRLLSEWSGDATAHLDAQCTRCGLRRSVSWQALASGSPACLACDRKALDPDRPHRVYLIRFRSLGDAGVYKVGITHAVHDRRLRDHEEAGGEVMATVTVPNRASALTVERHVLGLYLPGAAVDLPPAMLPRGGRTECWNALAGFPDLTEQATAAGVAVLGG